MKKKAIENDVVGLVEQLLGEAVKNGASDVHFEPTGRELVVKFRLDGVLKVVERLPKAISENVITRLKVLGGLLTYRNDIPQEGRISGQEECCQAGKVTDKRLAVFPTIYGQRAVVRMFYENAGLMELEKLGLSEYVYEAVRNFAGRSQGILLLTGPAGSGKSTTLAAILRHILSRFEGKSIVTLEDPVERVIEGVTQVQVPPAGQMTFPTALRSLLRQDPEVLMIGEIRDAQTAEIVIEAGLTGHLLMSTMHSGSCAGTLLRLLEMGIEPYQVTSSVSMILNQRLVRRLCGQCRKKTGLDSMYEATGCPECMGTGFKGRILISEVIELDGELRKAILQKVDLEELEQIIRQRGHMTMAQDAGRLVMEGLTTQQEIQKVCGTAE